MSLASNIHELLLGSAATYSYTINNSLRFRSSASAYLSRTPASASNRKTWTWSGWVKIGVYSGDKALFESQNGSTFSRILIDGGYNFACVGGTSGIVTTFNVSSAAIIRDPSSWYHFVVAFDTTQSTSSNRVKLYINGSQVTSLTNNTYPNQNTDWSWNYNSAHNIGREVDSVYGAGGYLDGYLSEVNFIDGLALDPSYFGATNTTTGTWAPKRYSGSYGTNGFYLPFSDTSGLTSGSNTGLGKDFSGNGNYWTTNNISLTAGSTYDAMLDSPTPKSTTVGNYAVLNPLAGVISGRTITSGNLNVATSASKATSPASMAVSSGKWYWEVTCGSTNNLSVYEFGIVATSVNIVESLDSMSGGSYCYYGYNGYKYSNTSGSAYGATFTNGDVIGHALDLDAGTLTFYKNNVSQGTAFTGLSGSFYPAACSGSTGSNINFIANFGQRPFSYTPPSGYKSLCTYNLPTPSIVNGASYMAATTYTGTGASQSITNTVNSVSFQPDLVWFQCRSLSQQTGAIYDSIRGSNATLFPYSTSSETTDNSTYGGLSAFNNNGFSITTGTDINTSHQRGWTSGATYVAWQWKANGTSVSNTSGTITSQVSANPTAGFSVVTYTGTGAAAMVGHGLGVAPSMIIVKSRSSGTLNWPVYHVTQGNNKGCFLNLTNAVNNQPNLWNSTTPTSSVFTLGTDTESNTNTATYVAYCFAAIAGYSAFGSYTGNGSVDGPFVYCGFRPRFVMVKRASNIEVWSIIDTSRDTYNVTSKRLLPNSSSAENTGDANVMDILSNGFKLRSTDSTQNFSGDTYIYAAFAENPMNYSLAR